MRLITRALATACGVAIGTLIYTRFMSSTHEFDWTRAIFIGLLTCLFSAIWSRKKTDQGSQPAQAD